MTKFSVSGIEPGQAHRIRLYLTSDDQGEDKPAPMNFGHASIGTSSLNTILCSSRLLLPIMSR
jgi:hypothetical protein